MERFAIGIESARELSIWISCEGNGNPGGTCIIGKGKVRSMAFPFLCELNKIMYIYFFSIEYCEEKFFKILLTDIVMR